MKRRMIALCSAALGASLLASASFADEITLKNGSTLGGVVASSNDEVVRLNRHGQEIAIRRGDIARIDAENLDYYNEEFKQAAGASDAARIARLLTAMRLHDSETVRAHAETLDGRWSTVQAGGTWQTENIAALSTPALRARFREAADRIRSEDVIRYGRELMLRGETDTSFAAAMLDAFKTARKPTHFLFMDAFRVMSYTKQEDMRVAQVYLLGAIEDRMIELWNPEKPDRTDSEINALMIVRGLLVNLERIAPADSPWRKSAEGMVATFVANDSWDHSIQEIDDLYTLLIFANASRARAELTPIFRYFALLKEPDILKAETTDPLLAESVREARGVYIYTVSGISPLPKEKLWSSARDLAIIGSEKAPVSSDVMDEVFTYAPQTRHLELAVAYEDILIPEAMRGIDKGPGLERALKLVVAARCGTAFDRERSWAAFEALAAFRKPTDATPPTVTASDALEAMFSVASPFEQEKVCLLYDERLTALAMRGNDAGAGIRRAISLVASRRATDTSEPARKWASFEALATLDRIASTAPAGAPITVSQVLEAAFAVCPEQNRQRLVLLFEDRLAEAALDPREHGAGLLESVRLVARHRADDLANAGASWRAFMALAAVSGMEPPAPGAPIAPTANDAFAIIFRETPQDRHGDIAARFEDNLVTAVVGEGVRGEGVDRAARSLAMMRLQNPVDPLSAWRAFELLAVLSAGDKAGPSQIMDEMAKVSQGVPRLRVNALYIATSRFPEHERRDNVVYRKFRDAWVEDVTAGLNAWVASTSRLQGLPNEVPTVQDILLAEAPGLKEVQIAVNDHARLLRDLDKAEAVLRERYRSTVDNVGEGNLRLIAQELNELWTRSASPAAQQRIRGLVTEVFDPATQAALVSSGLSLGPR